VFSNYEIHVKFRAHMQTKSAKEFVESNLRYVGKFRLEAMSEDLLNDILEEYTSTEKSVPADVKSEMSKADLIEKILQKKKNAKVVKSSPLSNTSAVGTEAVDADEKDAVKSVERPQSPSFRRPKPVCNKPVEEKVEPVVVVDKLPDGEKTRLIPSGEEGIALEVTVAKSGESTRVFKERHELRVASFNSLKLRTAKLGLQEQWIMLIATLSTFDIVLVQEVPAETIKEPEKTRAYLLKKAFEHHSGDEWSIILSEPCGPGNLEVHVALVRKPIEVISSCTNRTACSVPLDHAPLTIKIRDTRFKNVGDQTWVVNSVHFPPKSRARDRDVQIKAFLKEYGSQSAFRLDAPLTEKGAKDAKTATVHHLVCGDFNAHIGTGFELEKHEFAPPVLGECVSTSSGGQSYDNFVLSKFAASKFTIGSEVLELAMPAKLSKGEDGVSDHHPIVLKIKDTASTTSKNHRRGKNTTSGSVIYEEGEEECGVLV